MDSWIGYNLDWISLGATPISVGLVCSLLFLSTLFLCGKVVATVVTEETYYLDVNALLTLATRLPTQPTLHCPVVKKELPPRGLWTLPKSSWPSNQPLPNFCTFGFHMFNPETGRRLLQAAQTLPPPAGRDHLSWLFQRVSGMGRMAEVYITGLLASEAGLLHSDLAHLWTLNPLRQDRVSMTKPPAIPGLCRLS